MVMSALTQMLREVEWGHARRDGGRHAPGTGDAQLTMAQQLPLKGAVIVSDAAGPGADRRPPRHCDVQSRQACRLLGIVENMSTFICPKCGTRTDIFGHGGARREAERLGVPFLGEVPLEMNDPRDLGRRPGRLLRRNRTAPMRRLTGPLAANVRDQLGSGAAAKPGPRIVIES